MAKADQQSLGGLRLLQNSHRHFRDDAEEVLRSGQNPKDIEAAAIQMLAAKAQDLAVHQDHFQAENIVRRQTILQAMNAATFSATLPPMEQAIWLDGSGA